MVLGIGHRHSRAPSASAMLRAFKEYRQAAQEEQESLFLSGFATPSRQRSGNPMEPPDDYVKWEEVRRPAKWAPTLPARLCGLLRRSNHCQKPIALKPCVSMP